MCAAQRCPTNTLFSLAPNPHWLYTLTGQSGNMRNAKYLISYMYNSNEVNYCVATFPKSPIRFWSEGLLGNFIKKEKKNGCLK